MAKILRNDEAEVGIIATVKGKKFYVLLFTTNKLGYYDSRVAASDSRGYPLMWTTKRDMLSYAKKHGIYIRSGYNMFGGFGTGVKWQ